MTVVIPLRSLYERIYIRDLQEWLRCVKTCTTCGESRQLSRFPRTVESFTCFDCLDKLEEIPAEWIHERNRWRAYSLAKRQMGFVEEYINPKV